MGAAPLKDAVILSLLLNCLILISCALSGCGGGSNPSHKNSKTVLMMRHCVRGVDEKGVYSLPGFLFFNNYSKDPWPEFNPPGLFCQPYSKAVVQQSGKWFKEHGSLPYPLTFISDDSIRDITTTEQLLLGFGENINSYTISSGPFGTNPNLMPKSCSLSDAEKRAAMLKQMKRFPPIEPDFTQILAKVSNVLGTGVAGDWAGPTFTNTPCFIEENLSQHWWAPVNGGCYALSLFTERFLMEWGANMTVGWNRMQDSDIPELLPVHYWYLKVARYVPEIIRLQSASIAWAILDFLESDKKGTTVFVGHDTDQGALNAALGLSWDPSPFPSNATLPGSALRFDLDDSDNVHMSFVFVENFTNGGSMKSVPVNIFDSTNGIISLKKLHELVEGGFDQHCRTDNATRGTVEDQKEKQSQRSSVYMTADTESESELDTAITV